MSEFTFKFSTKKALLHDLVAGVHSAENGVIVQEFYNAGAAIGYRNRSTVLPADWKRIVFENADNADNEDTPAFRRALAGTAETVYSVPAAGGVAPFRRYILDRVDYETSGYNVDWHTSDRGELPGGQVSVTVNDGDVSAAKLATFLRRLADVVESGRLPL